MLADLLVLIPSAIQLKFWHWFDGVDPWKFIFIVSLLVLAALLIESYVTRQKTAFGELRQQLQVESATRQKQIQDSSQEMVRQLRALGDQLESRIANIWQEFEDKLKAEQDERMVDIQRERAAREHIYSSALQLINSLEKKLVDLGSGKQEKPTSSSAPAV